MRRIALVPLAIVALAAFAARCASPEATLEPTGFAIAPAQADTLVLAGGCFWCMEPPFETLDGVASVVSGFSGGTVPNPTYDEVARTKSTGHYEVVQVVYDPAVVSFDTLLQVYWHNVDPFDNGGQFCDRGEPYRPAIFVRTEAERATAEATKAELQTRFDQSIVVPVLEAAPFYAAEDYHQDFYRTNPGHYQRYRTGCRRDARLEAVWGDNAGRLGDAL
ncbi:MAG: peptide-methionine (S)-S-oxide reductase MsrA [Bacteroidota bacterium]